MQSLDIRTVQVVQYLKPLREGGSLPGLVKADDDLLYVIKFRGAGQGSKALIAELIGGELARAIGLKVPELVFMELDESLGRTEPDEEIQDLLKFSVGLNLGLHFLSGAITYDPLVSPVDPHTASLVVLLDSMITNIDRSPKNTNMLSWHRELWLIDHGASLYFHHNWPKWESHLDRGFPMVKDHVLLPKAEQLEEAAEAIQSVLKPATLAQIIATIPDTWLEDESEGLSPEAKREAYRQFLSRKLENLAKLAQEARHAR